MLELDPNKFFYTYPEAGKILGVGRKFVATLVREKHLETVLANERIPQITRASLQNFLRRMAAAPPEQPLDGMRQRLDEERHSLADSMPPKRTPGAAPSR